MDTPGASLLLLFFFFMMPDGRPCAQCGALSIASHTLIPRSVGTGRRARMKVAFHESDCCFNWSPEPRTPAPTPSFGTAYFSPLIFLLLSSGGAWSLSPSAAKACPRRPRWQGDGTRSLPRGRLRLFKSDGEQMMLWFARADGCQRYL